MIFGEGPIIKNIAGDLNKLFLQGTRAGQPINNVEGDAAADQGTIQLMADRDPVIRDISTGLGWAGREVTVSGTGPLQLVNSLGRPLKSWSVELAPYQEGSGDPYPYGSNPNLIPEGTNTANGYVDGCILSDTNSTPANANAFVSEYFPVVAGVEYTFSATTVLNTPAICFYDENKMFISGVAAGGALPKTVTAPVGAAYARGSQYKKELSGQIIQFEKGSSVTTPIRHSSNIRLIHGTDKLNMFVEESYDQSATPKAVITLPNTIYNGIAASDGGKNKWSVVDLGTLTWAYVTSGVNRFQASIANLNPKSVANNQVANMLCEAFPVNSATVAYGNNGYIALNAQNLLWVSATDIYADAQAFAAAMQGIKLIFELDSPTDFAITAPDIQTPRGNGSAWVTAEDGIITNFSAAYLQSE